MDSRETRNTWVDVIRGLAIFGVVAVHSTSVPIEFLKSRAEGGGTGVTSRFVELVSNGMYGVELFFFISGWLLASIYKFDANPISKNYWLKRLARIYPLWVLFLVIGIVRFFLGSGGTFQQAIDQAEISTYPVFYSTLAVTALTLSFMLWLVPGLSNTAIPGGWSIQAEVFHYLLFPFVRRISYLRTLKILIAVNLVTLSLIYLQGHGNFPSGKIQYLVEAWLRLNTYSTFAFFMFGAISAMIYKEYKTSHSMTTFFTESNRLAFWFFVYLLTFITLPLAFGNNIHALGFVSFMILLSFCIVRISMLSSFFTFIGKYSYFIYFSHFLILEGITHYLIDSDIGASLLYPLPIPISFTFTFILTLGASSLLAIPSWKYFESPFIRFSKRPQ
jgi:peptidoglycan/LPS O-acetylase OafA/YrhL